MDEVELFLKNMFNDKAIIEAPWFVRKFIANKIVKSRLTEAKENYKALGGKSPILEHTKKLIDVLNKTGDDFEFFYAMRYTPPFSFEVLRKIKDYDEFYAIPLYPHYSKTTTGSSLEDFFKSAKKLGIDLKKIKTVDRFYNNEIYNRIIVKRIKEALNGKNASEFELIFSAHGLPKDVIERGDPYMKEIKLNLFYARKELIKEGLHFQKTHLAYQSRVGPKEWIRPYLEDKLKEIKTEKVIIYPIAFLIDNSETDFELGVEYEKVAKELGIKNYTVAKAPNVELKDLIWDLISKMN